MTDPEPRPATRDDVAALCTLWAGEVRHREGSDLIAVLRPLWDELDRVQHLASEALAQDDMQAWADHAATGAEIHERIAHLCGWRNSR